MNFIQPLDDLEWQILIQNTAAHFSDVTIKRGFQYYKQGRVASLQLHESGHISALVHGREPYTVDLVPNALETSVCTCPVEKTCKHMVAVLMEAVNHQGRSIHSLVNAHSTARIRFGDMAMSSMPSSRQTALQEAQQQKTLSSMREKSAMLPESEISVWHQLFNSCISFLGMPVQNSLYAQSALQTINKIKPALNGVNETLFDLHARLFVLEQLVQQPQQSGASLFMGYHVQVAASDIEKDIKERFSSREWSLHVEPQRDPVLSRRIDETLDYVRHKMLTEPRNHSYFMEIYLHMWMHGLQPYQTDKQLYNRELKALRSAKEELGSACSRTAGLFAQSLLHFYMIEDEKVWELLRELDQAMIIEQRYLLYYLRAIELSENWPRMIAWLKELAPLLANYRGQHLSYYMQCWQQAIEHQPEAEPSMWDCLVDMLPFSSQIYQQAMLNHGKWKQWMDYQLSIGSDPLDFRVSELAPLEKAAPELLLPFYHQAVERYTLLKNRSSYKAAVKLLKRLAKLYKKTKQEDRWEAFLASYVNRNSRLRALREELRKGKLTL